MNKLISVLLFLIILNVSLQGQKIIPTVDDLYNDAIEFMYSSDYTDALPVLLNLRDNGNETANVNYLIGECYLNIAGQKTRALPFLKDACRNASNKYSGTSILEPYAPVKAFLYLGIAYRLNNNFETAVQSFSSYIQALDESDTDNRKLAEYHIERCSNARELIAAPAIFKADTVLGDLHSGYNFNPLLTTNEKSLFYMQRMKFYDAVMHSVKNEDQWQAPENLTPLVRSDGDHYLTGLSSDGSELFFTSYDPYRSGEIYSSKYSNDAWSVLLKLNGDINTIFNESHATLSPDSKTLYFTSDRKGGYGGSDIYKSVHNTNGEWGKPVNLGPLINTQYNEECPFISPDGKRLFFSSQGHYNMGGFDIFYASLDSDDNWLPPVNIGYPLNTTDDDLYFFPVESGNVAYQSRFSPFNAHPDIVRYRIISFGNPSRFMINGKVELESSPNYNPENILITFIDKAAMDTVATKVLNEDGSFRQSLTAGKYQIDFSGNNKTLLSKSLEIPEYLPHNNLVLHEYIKVPETMITLKDTLILRDIRFGFNQTSLDDRYIPYLDEVASIMVKYPEIMIVISGYADALGSDRYNLKISQLRAETVKEFLRNRLSSADRMTVNAKGESDPVAINKLPGGADNPQGRIYNRRVEINISNAPESLIIIKTSDIPESMLAR